MSTDTDLDAFELDLAARMEAASTPISGDGVTRDGVDRRVAQRHRSTRRRQGGLAVAAAAVVVVLGVGIAVGTSDDAPTGTTGVAEDGGDSEAPAPTSTLVCAEGESASGSVDPAGRTGDAVCGPTLDEETVPVTVCHQVPSTTVTIPEDTVLDTTPPPTTCVPAADAPTTETTGPPGSTTPEAAEPDTTAAPTTAPYGGECAPGPADPDCIDPEGDGTYVKLEGGAACMATTLDPAMCTDLDGDGAAGDPDSDG